MRTRRMFAAIGVAALVLVAAVMPAGAEGDASAEGWFVVEFDGRIGAEQRGVLTDVGADAVSYVPEASYVAWLAPDAVAALADAPRVTGVEALPRASKVDAAIDASPAPERLLVSVHASTLGETLDALGRLGEVAVHRDADPSGTMANVLLTAPRAAVPAIADLAGVRYVGPAPTGPAPLGEIAKQLLAGNREGFAKPEPGYRDWLDEVGLDGSGVRVSIVDTGIDPHPDFDDRLVAKVEYSRTVAEPLDVGHGTHVAGTVGGDPVDWPGVGRITDDDGFEYGLGVAPGVELVDQNAISVTSLGFLCGLGWPPDYGWPQLTEDALDHGASMYNASWQSCEGTGSGYIESARTFDILARNADWRTDEFEPFTFVFAAGNEGSGNGEESRITAPSEAKNLIAVAASTNWRGGGTGNQTASFSSRGPAVDGRVVPTVSAPGANIASQRAFTATAVCGIPPGGSQHRGVGLYGDCSGTSMAAPHVTGAVALFTEYWRERSGGADPSPALARAALVNTAEPLDPTRAIPNRHEGWGQVNIGSLFDAGVERVYVDQDIIFEDVDEDYTVTVTPADPDAPLRVTVAWSDAPGAAGANPALVNDLDLAVTADDGTTYLGNALDDSWSVPGGEPDRLNNIENVFIANPDGTYTITISAHQLPGDGVPGNPADTDQDFALVISNAQVVAD